MPQPSSGDTSWSGRSLPPSEFGLHGDGAASLVCPCDVTEAFPGRLMFEASGFLVSCASLLLAVTLVLRVDAAVSRWFKRLVPEGSR